MVQVYLKLLTFVNSMKFLEIQRNQLRRALFVGILLSFGLVNAQESEVERLSGFKKFKKDSQIYDQERQKAYSAYLESLEKDAFDQKKALEEYRKVKKTEKPLEDTKYYQQYLDAKVAEQKDADDGLAEFMKEKKKWNAKKYDRPFTEEYELGLLTERPRYDYKKRALYGAKPKYKVATPSTGAAASSPGAYSPPFDYGGDNGYIPPPPPPMEPFLDEIPPPPPMPMDGMGDFNNDGFIPPPPPPPPMFDGEF
jgi:hypothetical protein